MKDGKALSRSSASRKFHPEDSDDTGDETTRHALGSMELQRERERVALEVLRFVCSTMIHYIWMFIGFRSADTDANHRESVGGWGLGAGHEDSGSKLEEEDEPLGWDEAQVRTSPFKWQAC
jgi:hypothetical protein